MTITYQLRALIAEWLLLLAYLVMPAGVEKGALEKALDQCERDIGHSRQPCRSRSSSAAPPSGAIFGDNIGREFGTSLLSR